MINKIYEKMPAIKQFVEDKDITEERVLEIREQLSKECSYCPAEEHCEICFGLEECVYHETIDWEEEMKVYDEYLKEEALQRQKENIYDEWANNIGECESHFWGVCQGEEIGEPCKQPSPYGCSYKP